MKKTVLQAFRFGDSQQGKRVAPTSILSRSVIVINLYSSRTEPSKDNPAGVLAWTESALTTG